MAAELKGAAYFESPQDGKTQSECKETSLQDRFKAFQKEMHRARRTEIQAHTLKHETRSKEYCSSLRADFVLQVVSYIGTPYAQKYHKPDSLEYSAPLFLDCCGLIRQSQRDLQERFGFRLPKWNQNFMYDTLLPEIELSDASDGDLVFYRGDYVDEGKKQRLGLVHVEVLIRDGDQWGTIGSRWNNGSVSEWPDYRFNAKAWKNVSYHFCSIQPWLEGKCIPSRPDLWPGKAVTTVPELKKSIFAVEQLEADDSD